MVKYADGINSSLYEYDSPSTVRMIVVYGYIILLFYFDPLLHHSFHSASSFTTYGTKSSKYDWADFGFSHTLHLPYIFFENGSTNLRNCKGRSVDRSG